MKPILMIDPGHGGNDPGGGTNKHWKEKDMVLKISLYQYERFKELGVPVVLTRDKDVNIHSSKRTDLVKNSGAVFCISNHINAGGGRGWEIIHSIHDEGNLAREVEKEFNKYEMPKRRIFTRKYPGTSNIDYYFMHRETGSVATQIIEYGFADNEEDTKYLLGHWQEMAEAVVKAFCSFIGHPYHYPEKKDPELKDWKAESVQWLYDLGLLSGDSWKEDIEKPLPLWAEAIVLQRLYEKLKGER